MAFNTQLYKNKYASKSSQIAGAEAETMFRTYLARKGKEEVIHSEILRYFLEKNRTSPAELCRFVSIPLYKNERNYNFNVVTSCKKTFCSNNVDRIISFLKKHAARDDYEKFYEYILDKYYHVDVAYQSKDGIVTYEIKGKKKNYHGNEKMMVIETQSVGGYKGWALTGKSDYTVFFIRQFWGENTGDYAITISTNDIRKIARSFERKGRNLAKGDMVVEAHKKATYKNGYVVGRYTDHDRRDEFFYYNLNLLNENGIKNTVRKVVKLEKDKWDFVPFDLKTLLESKK